MPTPTASPSLQHKQIILEQFLLQGLRKHPEYIDNLNAALDQRATQLAELKANPDCKKQNLSCFFIAESQINLFRPKLLALVAETHCQKQADTSSTAQNTAYAYRPLMTGKP